VTDNGVRETLLNLKDSRLLKALSIIVSGYFYYLKNKRIIHLRSHNITGDGLFMAKEVFKNLEKLETLALGFSSYHIKSS